MKNSKLFDLDKFPFFEYRDLTTEKVGNKYQLYEFSIREQIKSHIQSFHDVGLLYFMECIDIVKNRKSKTQMSEITYSMRAVAWNMGRNPSYLSD